LESELTSAGGGDETVEKFIALVRLIEEFPGGGVSVIRPDGTQVPGSPLDGGGSITVDPGGSQSTAMTTYGLRMALAKH